MDDEREEISFYRKKRKEIRSACKKKGDGADQITGRVGILATEASRTVGNGSLLSKWKWAGSGKELAIYRASGRKKNGKKDQGRDRRRFHRLTRVYSGVESIRNLGFTEKSPPRRRWETHRGRRRL